MGGIPALAKAPGMNGGPQSLSDQYITAYNAPGGPWRAPQATIGPTIVVSAVLALNVIPEPQKVISSVYSVRDSSDPIIEYIKEVFGQEAQKALAVARCESGFNPYATNWNDAKITGKPSMGIFQLNRPYDEKYFDWKYNIDTAYKEFYLPRGWQPWTCATKLGIF